MRMLELGDRDAVGELLRSRTFVGEELGCYATFAVREDARFWSTEELVAFWRESCGEEEARERAAMGAGYSFVEDGLDVEVCWYWDGDGHLCYGVFDGTSLVRTLENRDCKKAYNWEDDIPYLEPGFRAARACEKSDYYAVLAYDPGAPEEHHFHDFDSALEVAEETHGLRGFCCCVLFLVAPDGERQEICRFLAGHLAPSSPPGPLSRPSSLAAS